MVLSCKGTFQIQNYLDVIIKPIYKTTQKSININKNYDPKTASPSGHLAEMEAGRTPGSLIRRCGPSARAKFGVCIAARCSATQPTTETTIAGMASLSELKLARDSTSRTAWGRNTTDRAAAGRDGSPRAAPARLLYDVLHAVQALRALQVSVVLFVCPVGVFGRRAMEGFSSRSTSVYVACLATRLLLVFVHVVLLHLRVVCPYFGHFRVLALVVLDGGPCWPRASR